MERTVKTLTVILSKDEDNVTAKFYDPCTGYGSKVVTSYSPDEHPEFNEHVGNALYWWINEYVNAHSGKEW